MFTKISRLVCILTLTLFFTGGVFTTQAFCLEKTKFQDDLKTTGICYKVKKGDTLSQIARDYNISLVKLMEINRLQGSIIYPGEILIVANEEKNMYAFFPRHVAPEDFRLLTKIIYAEARGESFLGQVAVGAVVLNRVKSPLFPNTIEEVIKQRNNNVYQFSPVADGTINLEPDETAFKAAVETLKGTDPTNGATFFYNPVVASDWWIRTLPVITRIGNHDFATSY